MKKIFFIVSFLYVGEIVNAQTGIGTTAPVNKFEVVATAADPTSSGSLANGNLRLGASSGSHVLDFGLSSTPTYAWLQARLKSNYATNYNLVLNPNGGLVGIGNTSPSSTLTVGNTAGTIAGELTLNPSSTQHEGGQIILKRSLEGSTVDWTIDQYGTTSANARFRIFNGISESNGMSILENGKIGVGVSSPSTMFHIQNGNTSGPTDPANNTLPSIYLYNTNSSSTSANSILALRTNGSGGGNPFISFDINGVRGYSMGMDNSDADKFKIIPNWNFTSLNSPILTFDTDSKVGIGTTSPRGKFHIQSSDQTSLYVESTVSDNNGLFILNANTDQNWTYNYHEFIYFQKQGNNIGSIIAANSGTGVTYNTTSDYRLKTDLKDFKGLDVVNKIKTYDFSWKTNNSRMHGVMAHELQEILPYAVTGKKDSVDANGKMITQGVDYGRITPVLVKAIQEQDIKINQLVKEKIELQEIILDMQRRLLKLENKNN